MLKAEVVQEFDSPWASHTLLVKKKDGGVRFCIDYRTLNAVTRKEVGPMPHAFSILEMGYWQIRMGPTSQDKTAFTIHTGLYKFRVMPLNWSV